MPWRPRMMPPVGKSGPGITSTSAGEVGVRRRRGGRSPLRRLRARLCGAIFVAMPTAMPSAPFTMRFGNLRGQDRRLLERAVVGERPVDRFLVDVVAEHLLREAREADLGVAHRGRRVAVDRAEVALPVHERLGHREVLRHPDDRVVDRRVAVRVVLAHDVADESGRLLVGPVVPVRLLPHPEEDAAVHGLEAVAHVGERAPDDDGHRVVEIAPLDLLFDGDGNLLGRVEDGRLFGRVGHVRCRGSRR